MCWESSLAMGSCMLLAPMITRIEWCGVSGVGKRAYDETGIQFGTSRFESLHRIDINDQSYKKNNR